MKTIQANEDEERLSRLLHEWKVEVALSPRFQEGVWRRLDRAETNTQAILWRTFAHWMESTFNRPALAGSYLAVLLLVGLTTGYLQAHAKSEQAEARWRTAYVQSVDPYQVPRNRP